MVGHSGIKEKNSDRLLKKVLSYHYPDFYLYPTISQKGSYDSIMAMRDFLAYADD